MKVVKVYGALKKRLGGQGTFKFDVNTPGEAIRALCANFPGLDQWLIDSKEKGIGYKTLIGKEKVTENNADKLIMPWSEKDVFKITPVVVGSGGRGFWSVVIGATLIAAAVFFAPAAAAGGGFLTAGAAGTTMTALGVATQVAGTLGVSMVLGGIAQMLSPMPDMPGTSPEANLITNYSFSGIQNTSPQGFPVPICYGRCITGSAVISASLDVV